jgi:signal transduction histidine kinase/CheY-like chemotaxis protein
MMRGGTAMDGKSGFESVERALSVIESNDLSRVFSMLTELDHAESEAEFEAGVPGLLAAIGKYIKAGRVYTFEWADDSREFMRNTFEYVCPDAANAVSFQERSFPVDSIPAWMPMFNRGEAVVIDDLAEAAKTMPVEAAMLRKSGVKSLIAFPIIARNDLVGIIGMNDPSEIAYTELFFQVLRSTAGHLGNIRTTLHIGAQLEEDRAQLAEALRQFQIEYEIISAIGKIYAYVCRVDLQEDVYEEISCTDDVHRGIARTGKASEAIAGWQDRLVSDSDLAHMAEFMDISTLSERMRAVDTVSTEFQAVTGEWYQVRYIVKKRDASGAVTNVLYCVQQVTDLKVKELEYQRSLEAAVKEAERANIAKTDFLRRMSHDVRTPINGIRGMIQIAEHFPDDIEKLKECRRKAWDSSTYLLQLVNSVLDMNKLESGDVMLEHRPFSLKEMLDDLSSMISAQAAEHGITVQDGVYRSTVDHWRVIGSPAHLKQVLANLSSNAIKYNKPGGTVSLSVDELSFDGARAVYRFECVDTGIGMSAEFQKHAFEPFVQEGSDSVVANYAGTGLGLSIAKELVEEMGGTISLESVEGEGSKFSVLLSFEVDKSEEVEIPAEREGDDDFTGCSMLLVEDNDLNAEIATFLLEDHGVKVTRACNGQEAVDLFSKSDPGYFDGVFMDIMMPVMDGLDAARNIRMLDRADADGIPIYAMSANAFADDVKRSLDAGMDGHLMKPLENERVLEVLRICQCWK